jgi:hypothetical protein
MLEETDPAHDRLCCSGFSYNVLCNHSPGLTRASRLLHSFRGYA